MLKGFVSGEEKDIVRIPMKGKNLWSEDYTGISGDLKYVPVFVGDGTFTLSTDTPSYSGNAPLFLLSGNVTSGASTPTNGVYNGVSRTTNSSNGYITIAFRRQSESISPITHKTMLNLGSTPLPYEPYGYQEGWEVRDNGDRILWGREDELQTATGTLPFKGYSLPLKVKSLLGNAVQNGTPAPDNIIIPEMCGVRTGNLFDTDGETNNKYLTSDGSEGSAAAYSYTTYIPVMDGEKYTISKTSTQNSSACHCWYDEDKQFISSNVISQTTVTLTAPASAAFLRCSYRKETVSEVMLNLGSTALPYEPYGWKVPFENHGENLFDKNSDTINNNGQARPGVKVPPGTYSIYNTTATAVYYRIGYEGTTTQVNSGKKTEHISANDDLYVWRDNGVRTDGVMLTPGSTPKPYSPYLNETIPVYLGEVPTVRRVKKLVLDGTENWSPETTNVFVIYATMPKEGYKDLICTHYGLAASYSDLTSKNNVCAVSKRPALFIKDSRFTTSADFKAYLASEYAAGHPVTIWYVLANEETTISNEPLCKISTYADELTTIQVHGLSAPLYGIGDYKDTLNLSTGVITRKVKKLVLTGTEYGWAKNDTISRSNAYYRSFSGYYRYNGLCSHYATVDSTTSESGIFFGGNINFFTALSDEIDTVDKWKSYLAAQYQAGTPITIWYILETPETETVTVPTGMTGEIEGYLTQVSTPTPTNRSVPKWNGVEETGGTYAVTVYTPPEIPTTTGQNTLTVDTNLAPSNLTVKGHIKELT